LGALHVGYAPPTGGVGGIGLGFGAQVVIGPCHTEVPTPMPTHVMAPVPSWVYPVLQLTVHVLPVGARSTEASWFKEHAWQIVVCDGCSDRSAEIARAFGARVIATENRGLSAARNAGVDAASRKVTEEATEVLLAAKDDATAQASAVDRSATRAALAGEAADLLYHALVLLAERGLQPRAVLDVLETRHHR